MLKSDINNEPYIGSTNDLKRRVIEHNDGKVFSTKRYRPWTLIYYEAFISEKIARLREKRLKYNGNAKHELMKRLSLVKSGAGFTLIEIIVVIAVISVMSVIGIASFVSYSRQATLNDSANSIKSVLKVAKSRASSQYKPPEITDCDSGSNHVLNGYKVVLSTGSTYQLEVVCDGNSFLVGQPRTLQQNITFTSTSSNFYFPVLVGTVEGDTTPPWTITVSNSAGDPPKVINIDQNGNIQ